MTCSAWQARDYNDWKTFSVCVLFCRACAGSTSLWLNLVLRVFCWVLSVFSRPRTCCRSFSRALNAYRFSLRLDFLLRFTTLRSRVHRNGLLLHTPPTHTTSWSIPLPITVSPFPLLFPTPGASLGANPHSACVLHFFVSSRSSVHTVISHLSTVVIHHRVFGDGR